MFRLDRSVSVAWALLISLNFSAASGLSGFLSGWYFRASFLKHDTKKTTKESKSSVCVHVYRHKTLPNILIEIQSFWTVCSAFFFPPPVYSVEEKWHKVTEHKSFGKRGVPITVSMNFVSSYLVSYHVKGDSHVCWKHRLQHDNQSRAFVALWSPTDLHHLAGFNKGKDFFKGCLKTWWSHTAYHIKIVFFIAKEILYLIAYQQ